MLNQQTIEKLYALRMRAMADAFTKQQEDSQATQLSFEERFALLVEREWNWRQNRALEWRIREARLQSPACMEDIDFRAVRGLDELVVWSLSQDPDWVRRHQHIFLVGPTGIGRTNLARAFGQKACRDGFSAYFAPAAQLCRELELARADLAVVPVMHRDPVQPVAVLQAAKHHFNALLIGVTCDNLFSRPVPTSGQE